MNLYEKIWRKANRWWKRHIERPIKQLFCRHEVAYHSKAVQYDHNPPHGRYRWAIVQREVCPKCGKPLGKSKVMRDNLSTTKCKEIMTALHRQQKRDFK
jgi:hypothetical protein